MFWRIHRKIIINYCYDSIQEKKRKVATSRKRQPSFDFVQSSHVFLERDQYAWQRLQLVPHLRSLHLDRCLEKMLMNFWSNRVRYNTKFDTKLLTFEKLCWLSYIVWNINKNVVYFLLCLTKNLQGWCWWCSAVKFSWRCHKWQRGWSLHGWYIKTRKVTSHSFHNLLT